jgi:hypothetical protein
MPGFTTRDDLVAEREAGKIDRFDFVKSAHPSGATSRWSSYWASAGLPPAGSNPATTPGTIYIADATNVVTGSMWFPDRSTDQRYLHTFGAISDQSCTLMLYDKLAGVSGISLASTGDKTINTGALDRYTGTAADLNEVWLEYTTTSSTTASITTVNSYTSADGSTAQSGGAYTALAAAMAASQMVQHPLSATKKGVRSVETLNVGTATTSGIVNVLIIRPLARITLLQNQWNEINLLDDFLDLPRIYDNACLGLMEYCAGNVAANTFGTISCVYG